MLMMSLKHIWQSDTYTPPDSSSRARRPPTVSSMTYTIAHVKKFYRRTPTWMHALIFTLACDFPPLPGADPSAADTFVRMQRSLFWPNVVLVIYGASDEMGTQSFGWRSLATPDMRPAFCVSRPCSLRANDDTIPHRQKNVYLYACFGFSSIGIHCHYHPLRALTNKRLRQNNFRGA